MPNVLLVALLCLCVTSTEGYASKHNSGNKCTPTSDASVTAKVGDKDGKHGTYKQGTTAYQVLDSNGFIVKSGSTVNVGSKLTVSISFTSGNQIVTDLVGMTAAGVLTSTSGVVNCGGGRAYATSTSKSFKYSWTLPSSAVPKAEITGVYGPNGGTVFITPEFFVVVDAVTTVVTKPGEVTTPTTAGQTVPVDVTTTTTPSPSSFDQVSDNPFCPCADDFGEEQIDAKCLSCRKRVSLEVYCQDSNNNVRAGCPGVAPINDLTNPPGRDSQGDLIPTLPPPPEASKSMVFVVGIPLGGLLAGAVFGVLATLIGRLASKPRTDGSVPLASSPIKKSTLSRATSDVESF